LATKSGLKQPDEVYVASSSGRDDQSVCYSKILPKPFHGEIGWCRAKAMR